MVITEDFDSSSHQSPIALPVNFFPFNLYPSTAIHQVTEYVYESLLNDHLCVPRRGVTDGNGGPETETSSVFFNLRVISACCPS